MLAVSLLPPPSPGCNLLRGSHIMAMFLCLALLGCGQAPSGGQAGSASTPRPTPSVSTVPEEELPGDLTNFVPPPRPTPSVSISPEEVREIAERFLPGLRSSVRQNSVSSPCTVDPSAMCPHEGYPKYGFNNQQEVEQATVGTPAEHFNLWPATLKAWQSGQSLDTLVTPTYHWIVPVTVNGEGRNEIEVGWSDGKWQMSGCCSEPSISRNLTVVQQRYAKQAVPVKIIFVPQAIYLAWVTEDEQELLILLRDPTYYPTLREKVMKPYPASEFLRHLANVLLSE